MQSQHIDGVFWAWAVLTFLSLGLLPFLPHSAEERMAPSPFARQMPVGTVVVTATVVVELAMSASKVVALHPGTVDTALSRPFAKAGLNVRPAGVAAHELLAVLDGLTPAQSGGFFDYRGQALPW